MIEIASMKNQLIDQLWLPIAKKGGATFYPRLRINKKMKMLTLVHHSNCREIEEFIKSKLTKKELIIGWNKGRNEAIRLECEKLESVIGGYVYEDTIYANRPDIHDKFPFDIVNLDFSSQSPELENGRIEKEILSIEHTIKIQSDKENKGMVLIYTTILNSRPLNPSTIKRNSNGIGIRGWGELSINDLPSNTKNYEEKIRCLEKILKQVCSKHQYKIIEGLKKSSKSLSGGSKLILSIGMLLKREKYDKS